LSMKNAMELPKYSKTLHFGAISVPPTGFAMREKKANLAREMIGFAMLLAVFQGF